MPMLRSNRMKIGSIVECVDNGGDPQAYHVTVGKRYVVCELVKCGSWRYIKVLGDDDRAHQLSVEMFRLVKPSK